MPKNSATEKPWERQKGESAKAFEAFVVYRDMGASRTVSAVSEKLSKSRQLMTRWKSAWNWDERARAYDNDLEKQAKAQAVKRVKEMTDRHVRIAMELQGKALEALKALPIEEMAPKDILAFIEKAAALERLNRMEAADLDKEGRNKQEEAGPRSLADAIMQAYSQRKEDDGQ